MIFLFRKEIKKWNVIWWFVLASLGLGGASFFFVKQPTKESLFVANVDGKPVSLKTFHQVFAELKSSLDDLAMYWGVPAERLAQVMGMGSLEKTAFSRCVQGVLFDEISDSFNIQIDSESFSEALGASIGRTFIDQTGKVNVKAYQNYLNKLRMSIADFERSKEDEFKRNMVSRFIHQSSYLPKNVADDIASRKSMQKRFSILRIPHTYFVGTAKKEAISEKDLKAFYQEKRELYRIPEKRKANYWVLTPDQYKEKVVIEDKTIEQFYEKNKSSSYRIPPKVKIRRIVLNIDAHASPDVITAARKKAESLVAEAKKNPKIFAELVQKNSHDKEGVSKGGLTDFFSRGSYDTELEKTAFVTLKKSGDISDPIRTKSGFEIIKLEDRISATEKPLADVREEIIKTLKNRKAMIALRGDLESIIRTSRSDKAVFEKFAQENNLKTTNTDWLTKVDSDGSEMISVVATKLFSDQGRVRASGYFVHRGKHILYRMIEKEESRIPSFEKVKGDVEADWYELKAKNQKKEFVRKLKLELFDGKETLVQVEQKYGFKLILTKFVKPGDEIESLKDTGSLLERAFLLNDLTQVLEYEQDSDYYIVKLNESKKGDGLKTQGEKEGLSEQEQSAEKQRYLDAFIASLLRNAKIETNEELLKTAAVY